VQRCLPECRTCRHTCAVCDAATGATFSSSMAVYDSLGTANTVQVTWTKTGSNAWSAAFANPTSSSDTSTTTGTASGSVAITSNSDGPLASTTPSPATLSVTGWTDGARRLDRQPQSRHGRQD